MDKPNVICLTPVRNEAWILDRFLKAASCWADYIIVADQNSDDGSTEIIAKYPKVVLIHNTSETFNEPERQKMLIDEARKIPGKRLLIALDADEFLSANCLTSVEWSTMLQAPEGTAFRFDWCTIQSDLSTYWVYPHEMVFGFMDDGGDHAGKKIHSPRLPFSDRSPRIYLKQLKVMHYAFTDFDRMQSRQRWYQCWELLNNQDQRTLSKLYRFYHKDENIPSSHVFKIPNEWFRSYEEHGVDMTSVYHQRLYRWDREVLGWFESHSCETFSNLAIWDQQWDRKYRMLFEKEPDFQVRDPRSKAQKRMHDFLERTQCHYVHYGLKRSIFTKIFMRLFMVFFKPAGW
jgi:glycosyltransferase involved in cell wall biosynthesis